MKVETFLNQRTQTNLTRSSKGETVTETVLPWSPPVKKKEEGTVKVSVVTVKEEADV